jgi:hypothetical protein
MNRNTKIFIAVCSIGIGALALSDREPERPKTRQELLIDNDLYITAQLNKAVANQFKHPEEVEILNLGSMVSESVLHNADDQLYLTNGFCTAKNSFGVKSKYFYEVQYRYTPPKTVSIIKVLAVEAR